MSHYAALVSLVQLLEDIIYRDRYQNIFPDIQQKSASVYGKFSFLRTLLDDYSPKDREAAGFLERRIRDAAYQAQDIIESHISKQVHQKDKTHGVERVLRHLISALQKAILGQLQPQRSNVDKEYQDLEKVKEEVDSIVEELMIRTKKSQTTEDLQLNYNSADAGTSKQAPSSRNTMEGVEEHLKMIKHQLCGESPKLQVVSIVGTGGIGKTTLAENIFHDELITYHFDCSAWVTVSQDYHLENIFGNILTYMNVAYKSSEEGRLGEKVYKHLKGRRYLIMIDDIWETKVWDDMKRMLPNDSNGSRIMITTRILDVAFYASTFRFFHQMQFLTEDQSWNLFRKKVFCPPELEDIGRLIAKNCRGLPLAIVVVAGLLSKVNKKRSEWEEIARNVSSAVAENDEHFSKIISLSYNNLPHHLKPLFLYMGGFPEDYEIPVSKLVKLWIAEGFLKPIEPKSLEEVAEEYLEDLVKRNLVLITKKRFNGKIKCWGIHDVLRDLCTEIVCYENFLHVLDENDYIRPATVRNVRRIYIHPARSTFTEAEECGSHVRSIIRLSHDWNCLSFGSGFKLLRVLHAIKIIFFSFPPEILELFHLRYLALSDRVLPIPPSISKLQNLQTLILVSWEGFGQSFSLPSQIWEMPNLRHIMVCRLELPLLSEETIVGEPSILEHLQTLSWVVNVRFTNEVIEAIPNLQKLKVLYYETSRVWQKFHLNNLFHLRQLETLNIRFPDRYSHTVHPFPESFSFPSMLKKLSLRGCRIPWKDLTAVGSLPNLQVLKLRDNAFVGEKWESVEGEFPQLRFLLMENLGIKYWQAENTHFPTLERLKISSCWYLQEIPLEIGEISTLELVEVNFSKLAAKSALKMQEEQRDNGNDVLQVRVYPQYRNSREEEASESEEEIQEEASESKGEIQEDASLESNKDVQEITPVN